MKFSTSLRVLLGTILPLCAAVVILVLVIAWMSGMFQKKIQPGTAVVPADTLTADDLKRTAEVREVVQPYFEEAVGTLKAASRTEISARVMASINRITVRAGSRVEEGAVLIELDSQALKTQLSQAQSALAAAESGMVRAKDAYDRVAKLRAKDSQALSQETYNEYVSNLEVAQARRQQAEQAVAEVAVLLSYTTIKAPRAGMVVDRLAEEGDMARPGVPLLVLYDPTSLRLEVPVMENLAVKLKVGQTLPVLIDAQDREVEAAIDEIVPQAEAASRSFLVKSKLTRSEGLFEGMFGRLRIPAGQRRYLCLPVAALHTVGQLQFVDVVSPDGKSKERRYVETGRSRTVDGIQRIEVLSGLKAGERVLLSREQ